MSRRPRRNHTPAFKAKVALAAIKGDRILAQQPGPASTPGCVRFRLSRAVVNPAAPALSQNDRRSSGALTVAAP